ncbi:MAG: hypothetical protein H6727_09965 [Myxococcales bacterium]|nr:hypothetical protein [Myxococcales bacterium]
MTSPPSSSQSPPQTPIPSSPLVLTEGSLDALKLLALLLMTLDHTNQSILGGHYDILTNLGRAAYPLFCFAMACNLLRNAPLDRYITRMVAFALLSQPFYILAFDESKLNVLFVLCLAALVSRWLLEQSPRTQHIVFALSLLGFFLKDPVEYDVLGLVYPAAITLGLQGHKRGWFWCVLLSPLLNMDLDRVVEHNGGSWDIAFQPKEFLWVTAAVLLLPVAVHWLCKQLRTPRFLPKYLFYVYYPLHLGILALWRLLFVQSPWDIFSL